MHPYLLFWKTKILMNYINRTFAIHQTRWTTSLPTSKTVLRDVRFRVIFLMESCSLNKKARIDRQWITNARQSKAKELYFSVSEFWHYFCMDSDLLDLTSRNKQSSCKLSIFKSQNTWYLADRHILTARQAISGFLGIIWNKVNE